MEMELLCQMKRDLIKVSSVPLVLLSSLCQLCDILLHIIFLEQYVQKSKFQQLHLKERMIDNVKSFGAYRLKLRSLVPIKMI